MNNKHLILHKKTDRFYNGYHFTKHYFWQCLLSSSTDFRKFANREQFHQSEMFSLSFFQLLPLFSAIPNAVFVQMEGWFFFALLIVEWNFMEITFLLCIS